MISGKLKTYMLYSSTPSGHVLRFVIICNCTMSVQLETSSTFQSRLCKFVLKESHLNVCWWDQYALIKLPLNHRQHVWLTTRGPIVLTWVPRCRTPDNDMGLIEDGDRVLSIWEFLLHTKDARYIVFPRWWNLSDSLAMGEQRILAFQVGCKFC